MSDMQGGQYLTPGILRDCSLFPGIIEESWNLPGIALLGLNQGPQKCMLAFPINKIGQR